MIGGTGSPEGDNLLETCYGGLEPFLELFSSGSAAGGFLTSGGVSASIIPEAPERSLFNAVVFDRQRPAELPDALAAIEAEIERLGINACGVWAVEGDVEAEAAIVAAGFELDSTPRAMGASIDELDLSAAVDRTLTEWDMDSVSMLNEKSYDLDEGEFAAVLAQVAKVPNVHCFIAHDDGAAAACVMTLHTERDDCTVYMVATDPARRRSGHASRAMTAALRHAKEAGCVTTTLQATKHGAPLYERLGYRDLGLAVNLWEKRKKSA